MLFSVIYELCAIRGDSLINGANSNKRKFLLLDFPIEQFKKIKLELGCSLNQLFLTMITFALRKFHEKYQAPIKPLRAIVPINTRQAEMRHKLGNHLTGVGLMLPQLKSNILEQLKAVITSTKQIQSSRLYGIYALLGRINASLPLCLQPILCNFQARKTNFISSSILGPRKPLYLAGAKIIANYGVPALMSGHGLGFSMYTYQDKVHCCIVSDPQIVPNVEEISAEVIKAKDLLLALSLEKGSSY